MKYFYRIISIVLLGAALSGCATQSYLKCSSFVRYRTYSMQTVTQTTPFFDGLVSFTRGTLHLGKASEQYRWVRTIGGDWHTNIGGGGMVLVPDQIPVIHKWDALSIWYPDNLKTDDDLMQNTPVVLAILCHAGDSACFSRLKKEPGGFPGVANRIPPDLSKFTFSRYFDKNDNPLPHPLPGLPVKLTPPPSGLPSQPDCY